MPTMDLIDPKTLFEVTDEKKRPKTCLPKGYGNIWIDQIAKYQMN